MTGLFNTMGHETENQTEIAASNLFEGLALVYQMLSKIELKDVKAAHIERQKAAVLLTAAASEFEALAGLANDRPLFWPMPNGPTLPPPESFGLSELRDQLHRYGISLLLRNRDLFQVAAREIRLLVDVIQHVAFTGRHADWYVVRDVVDQLNRLTTIGVAFSRIASLHGKDPQLQG
jgi:hypothetical protein